MWLTLAQPELRAPAAGIVIAVNGHLGETPGQTPAPSSAAESHGSGGDAFIKMITFDRAIA
jgi:hypothetical protein